jgi:hypothetical protein
VECNGSANACGDPGCIVCLYEESLIATFRELPGWLFVLQEAGDGDCEVVVCDAEATGRLVASGKDVREMMGELRGRALAIQSGSGQQAGAVDSDIETVANPIESFVF